MVNSLRRRGVDLLEHPNEFDDFDITIFMPCRNEAGNVGRALKEIVNTMTAYSYNYEIIVIDDASIDNSVAEIKNFIAAHPAVNILLKCNLQPMGVSYNFSNAALLGRGQYFRMIGAHFQDRAEAIKNVFNHLGEADIILTYIDPDYRASHRKFLSRLYTKLVNFISGYQVCHYHGTPLHRRIDVLRWHSYRSVGFYADMTTRLLDEGITYIEVPTPAYEREKGKSRALRLYNVISLAVGFADMLFRRFSKVRIPAVRLSQEIDA